MEKRTLFVGGLCLWLSVGGGAPAWADDLLRLASPDGEVEVRVFTENGRLFCTAKQGGEEALAPSPLGIVADGVDLGLNVSASSQAETEKIDESYPLFGNHANARNCAVEATLPLEASGKRYTLFVRA